jgi:hypothetical protein
MKASPGSISVRRSLGVAGRKAGHDELVEVID